jgi:hypothetical protein
VILHMDCVSIDKFYKFLLGFTEQNCAVDFEKILKARHEKFDTK